MLSLFFWLLWQPSPSLIVCLLLSALAAYNSRSFSSGGSGVTQASSWCVEWLIGLDRDNMQRSHLVPASRNQHQEPKDSMLGNFLAWGSSLGSCHRGRQTRDHWAEKPSHKSMIHTVAWRGVWLQALGQSILLEVHRNVSFFSLFLFFWCLGHYYYSSSSSSYYLYYWYSLRLPLFFYSPIFKYTLVLSVWIDSTFFLCLSFF